MATSALHIGTGARLPGGGILALGFGTTVAMWFIGYVVRFPGVAAPGWLLMLLLMLCLVAGGFLAGRASARSDPARGPTTGPAGSPGPADPSGTAGSARLSGLLGGIQAGLLAGVLNLLVMGSLLGGAQPNHVVPSALWWLPGSLLASGLLGGAGGLLGARGGSAAAVNWTGVLARVTVAATFLLLVAGGIVTGKEAGLAVVDWPNSFGYYMFLYPLSRMTGGIYYEHAHRLLGSLVGLTTLVLVVRILLAERRSWVKRFAVLAFLVVITQGLLGGLRVTGRFTTTASPAETAPSMLLAIVHGVTGQVFFAMTVALAVFTSLRWQRAAPPLPRPIAGLDVGLARLLVLALLVQIVFGAILRHVSGGLMIHITLAGFVVMIAILAGLRAGLQKEARPLPHLGQALIGGVILQVMLGVAALVAIGAARPAGSPRAVDVVVTTTHQAVGALLLAGAVSMMLWLERFRRADRLLASDPSVLNGTGVQNVPTPSPERRT